MNVRDEQPRHRRDTMEVQLFPSSRAFNLSVGKDMTRFRSPSGSGSINILAPSHFSFEMERIEEVTVL